MEKLKTLEEFKDLKEGQFITVCSGGKRHKERVTNVNRHFNDCIVHTKDRNGDWFAYYARIVLKWGGDNCIYSGWFSEVEELKMKIIEQEKLLLQNRELLKELEKL